MKKTLPVLCLITAGFLFLRQDAFAADITPPSTTYVQTPSFPDGNNGWYVSNVRFDLTATDLESGVKEIWYQVDGGSWQKQEFPDSLNLIQNPSFEISAATSSGMDKWEASTVDGGGSVSQDLSVYASGYDTASAKVEALSGTWHGINNKDNFSAATYLDNMNASLWLKTQSVNGAASYKIYSVAENGGSFSYQELAAGATITGTTDWTLVSTNFIVNTPNAIGVYVDVGLSGGGTVWIDAVNINSATTSAAATINVGSDSANHQVAFYSVDRASNAETYSCSNPLKNCVKFKSDQTPPENWGQSQGHKGPSGNNYDIFVYIEAYDYTSQFDFNSGIFQYMYHTELNPGFGRFTDLLDCETPWQSGVWAPLTKYKIKNDQIRLRTSKTSLCNNNWSECKIVRFYAQDIAGNVSTKDVCINGPWIKVRGGGAVRANNDIIMLAEGQEDNTDGLIEVGGAQIDFFTSTKGWKVKNSQQPVNFSYTEIWNATKEKTQVSALNTSSGIFWVEGDLTLGAANIPPAYSSTNFNQIVFVNGNLTISDDIWVNDESAALFVVSGNVNIDKSVETVGVAIFADGLTSTAYNLSEGDTTQTLVLNGIFAAGTFDFQRTLQGTDNSKDPAEEFNYEPKYLVLLKDYFSNYTVKWISTE